MEVPLGTRQNLLKWLDGLKRAEDCRKSGTELLRILHSPRTEDGGDTVLGSKLCYNGGELAEKRLLVGFALACNEIVRALQMLLQMNEACDEGGT